MIGLCCSSEFDTLFLQLEALTKVNGVAVERVSWSAGHEYPGFLVKLWMDLEWPISNREPADRNEWAVFYLAKGLRYFHGIVASNSRSLQPPRSLVSEPSTETGSQTIKKEQ